MISLHRTVLGSLGALTLVCVLVAAEGDPAGGRLKALIVDGQNNHPWQQTTPVLEGILKSCGRFDVAVATSPPKGQSMDGFQPVFKDFDVIVLNYNGADWPEPTRTAFVDYVRAGGGVVVVHAANNSFPNWPEFNEIIGLGGWGGRNEKSGPLVRWRDGKVVFENKPGRAGSHPKPHEYKVVTRNAQHPIVANLPETWLHVADELYADLRGPAKNLDLIATAHSNAKMRNGTGENEPALFTIRYGEGRIFHTILGHAAAQMQCVGFIVTLQRGTEWAATGTVTLTDVPADFPTANKVSSRPLDALGVKAPAPQPVAGGNTIADPYAVLPAYKYGDDRAAATQIEAELRNATASQAHEIEGKLIAVLENPEATVAAKDFACRMLYRTGGVRSIPVLANLLADERLSHMARYALQDMPGPAAAKVLQDALATVSDPQKIGVLSSLAARGDRGAIDAIIPLLAADSIDLRRAAISALGTLGGPAAADAIAAVTPTDELRETWLDARLKCADSLVLDEGTRSAAVATFRELRKDTYPAPVRIAAVRGLVSAGDEDGVQLLCSLLRSEDARLRRSAGALIAALPAGRATEALAGQMDSLEPDAQLLLVSAFASRGDTAAAPVVARATASQSPEVREAALRALATVGGAEHVTLLLKAATGDGPEAEIARGSLVRLSAPGVDEALLAVAGGKGDAATRVAAISALVARGVAAALPAYLAAARDADESVRLAGLKGLAAYAGPEQAAFLVAMLVAGPSTTETPLIESAIAESATADAGTTTVAAVAAAMESASPAARGALLAVLGRIGGEDALALVRKDLKSGDADVMKAAIRAMSQWKDAGPLSDLLAIVKGDGDVVSRVLAFRGYVDLLVTVPPATPKAQSDALAEAMDLAPRTDEKKLVLSVLPKAPCRATLALAEACVDNVELAEEAKVAVAQIKRVLEGIIVLAEEATLPAKEAKIHGEGAEYEPAANRDCIGLWESAEVFVTWDIETLAAGEFVVSVSQSMKDFGGTDYVVEVAGQKLPGVVKETGDWAKFSTFEIGKVTFPSAGAYQVAFKVVKKPKKYVANLRSITFKRADAE